MSPAKEPNDSDTNHEGKQQPGRGEQPRAYSLAAFQSLKKGINDLSAFLFILIHCRPLCVSDLASYDLFGHNANMPKRSSKKPVEQEQPTEPAPEETPPSGPLKPEKNPAAVALGKLGGAKGGKARAAKLTAERRREIAKKAAAARWKDR